MGTHELKTWPEPFEAVWDGRKTYEIRNNDRGFVIGDTLVLREWHKDRGYSGRVVKAKVSYATPGGEWGLPSGVVVMALADVERSIRPTWGAV